MSKFIPLAATTLLLGLASARAFGQSASWIVDTDITSQPTIYEVNWRGPDDKLHSGSGASTGAPAHTGTNSGTCSIYYKISNLTYHGAAAPSNTVISFNVYYKAQIIAQLAGSNECGVSGGSITVSADIRDQHPSGALSRGATEVSDIGGGATGNAHKFLALSAADWTETQPGVWVVALRTIDHVIASASVSYNSGLPSPPPGGPPSALIADDGGNGSAVEAQEDFTVTITP